MTKKLISSVVVVLFLCTSVWAQKTKTTTKKNTASSKTSQQSNAEKMGYARTSKYWGPGTYYCYAPGAPTDKMVNTSVSVMRDLIGIWASDFYTEIGKQGYTEVPKKEFEKWFHTTKNKEARYFYSPDKSFVLTPGVKDLENSPRMPDGKWAQASCDVLWHKLIPKEDTAKVIEEIWQYFRDLHKMKIILGSVGSNYKKADLKVYPIQRVGVGGWAGLRVGSFVLMMENGKPKPYYEMVEDIIRRTMTKPDFELKILGMELAYGYGLTVNLEKEGYVLRYQIVSVFFKELEPGRQWPSEYPTTLEQYKWALKMQDEGLVQYKKSPAPPVIHDLNKILHLK
jgi:hypothetical protein